MIIDAIILILTSPIIQRAILASVLVAVIAATSGTFMVFRGLSFLTAGVAHAALGGVALALFLQATGIAPWFDPILGAVIFAIFVAVMTAYAGERGIAQKMEVAVGVSFALSMSIAVFLMYYLPSTMVPIIWGYLVGDILLLDNLDIILLLGVAFSLVILFILFKKEYWQGLIEWFKDVLIKNNMISPKDLRIFHVVETPQQALEIVNRYGR